MSGMNKWSSKFEYCVGCLKTTYKYMARGLCSRCYLAEYNAEHQAAVKEYKRQWYARNGGPALSKIKREERNFAGLREEVLKRDGYKCTICGSTEKLVVHHKDGKGRGHKSPNNNLDNLTTRCRACHLDDHRLELWAARKLNIVYMWSKRYNLTACKQCGSDERLHRAFGLCWKCYATNRRIVLKHEKETTQAR